MSFLSDDAISRLRTAASAPDLRQTRYRLVGEIGRGGMSTVFLAEDPSLGRRVALKVLDVPDENGELAERLKLEARVLAQLEHPGIAPVHDVGSLPDGRVFYAMKFVEGPRLDTYAASPASLSERLRLFQRVAETVAFAHDRKLLHRDLKPENIMVGPFGEVLVMDWGLAKTLGAPEPPAVLGTPGYMAPEQARGDVSDLDARADIYALGAVLYFLLVRQTPTVSGIVPVRGVPPPLLAVCAKAMASSPEDRYPDALALNAEISRFLEGRRVVAYPEGILKTAARLYGRHKIAFFLVAGYVAVRGMLLFFTGR
jgi:serine/threonine protein kinase